MKPTFLVPVYNHGRAFRKLARTLDQFDLPVIVVDDGSDRETRRILDELNRTRSSFTVIRLDRNRGKGKAFKTGIKYASEQGFSHAIQIDADYQHDPSDVPEFLEKASNNPDSLVLGVPQFDDSIPAHRFYFRFLTHVWIWIETLSFDIPDALCGYRAYPVESSLDLIRKYEVGNRMEFDPGFAVRFYWEEGKIETVNTHVRYPQGGRSNYNPIADTVRITWMHTRSVFGMLYRFPTLLRRKLSDDVRTGGKNG